MPCYNHRTSPDYINEHEIKPLQRKIASMQKRLDVTTRLACDYCQLLEIRGAPIPDWATAWWAVHKILDEKKTK